MRWPFSSSSGKDGDSERLPVRGNGRFDRPDWQHYSQVGTWIPTLVATTTILLSVQFYRSYLRRFPGSVHIRPNFFRSRSLLGQVTSVGDGDNFHLFHTPGGRLAGWGWIRKVPAKKSGGLKNQTVSVLCLL